MRKVRPVLSAREVAFIKDSALRDNNLLCSWIVELPDKLGVKTRPAEAHNTQTVGWDEQLRIERKYKQY